MRLGSGGFVYNGRRHSLIGETITTYPGGVATVSENRRFVYEGNQIVLQFDRTDGNAMAASDLSHRYLWGPAVDQLMADEQVSNSGLVVWALTDNENTVRDLAVYNSQTNTTTIVNHQVFSAYGQMVGQTNPSSLPTADCLFGYTGRPFDAATGLQNNDNRWYDAVTGRWLSQDPVEAGTNFYCYCGNEPTNAVDPSGLVTATVVTNNTTKTDASDWYWGGMTFGLYYFNVSSTDDMISRLEHDHAPGTITILNISGHGYGSAGVNYASSPAFYADNLTDEQVRRLQKLLAPDAVVNLYSCDSGNGPTQKLANKLNRVVWALLGLWTAAMFGSPVGTPGIGVGGTAQGPIG